MLKASAVKDGEGLWSYVKMHQWFMSTTDLGKTNQRIDIMRPPQCKHDWEVAEAVEKWEEKYRIVKEEDGDQELPEKYRMTALKCILVGYIKKHIELREEDIKTYEEMRAIIMKWAVNEKIEKDKGHAPMDIGKVEAEGYQRKVSFVMPGDEERFSVYNQEMWEGIDGCQPCGDWVLETSWDNGDVSQRRWQRKWEIWQGRKGPDADVGMETQHERTVCQRRQRPERWATMLRLWANWAHGERLPERCQEQRWEKG